jgi:hypothetical protein
MPSSYQVVLWKQESFVVPRLRQIEFFRDLLEEKEPPAQPPGIPTAFENPKKLSQKIG